MTASASRATPTAAAICARRRVDQPRARRVADGDAAGARPRRGRRPAASPGATGCRDSWRAGRARRPPSDRRPPGVGPMARAAARRRGSRAGRSSAPRPRAPARGGRAIRSSRPRAATRARARADRTGPAGSAPRTGAPARDPGPLPVIRPRASATSRCWYARAAVEVGAGAQRGGRRLRRAGGQLVMLPDVVDGAAVADHVAEEAPPLAQRVLQQRRAGDAGLAVDRVVGRHHRGDAPAAHGGLEVRQVGVGEIVRADARVERVPVRFGTAVHGEVLRGGDGLPVVRVVALHAGDERDAHARGQERVLAERLVPAPPARIAEDVDVGREERQPLVAAALAARLRLVELRAPLVGDDGRDALAPAGRRRSPPARSPAGTRWRGPPAPRRAAPRSTIRRPARPAAGSRARRSSSARSSRPPSCGGRDRPARSTAEQVGIPVVLAASRARDRRAGARRSAARQREPRDQEAGHFSVIVAFA